MQSVLSVRIVSIDIYGFTYVYKEAQFWDIYGNEYRTEWKDR
jgi:hypothetical protein